MTWGPWGSWGPPGRGVRGVLAPALINALKQYLRTQAGTSFTSACVAVMWRIPLPNSSPTSTCPPFFAPWKLMTFSQCKTWSSLQSRDYLFYCLCLSVQEKWRKYCEIIGLRKRQYTNTELNSMRTAVDNVRARARIITEIKNGDRARAHGG